ncbi:MAG: universal stress protein [Spirochaetales bacterium]|nr:universal stress protein [Spirochaetales bacterium]
MSEKHGFYKIVFCTDFSGQSLHAFEYALDLAAGVIGSELIILHVIHEPDAQFWKTYIYEIEKVDESAKKAIDDVLEKTYLPLIPSHQHYSIHITIGNEQATILEFARKNSPDLIVIGKRTQTSMGMLFHGNLIEHIVRKSICPVLVVPYKG